MARNRFVKIKLILSGLILGVFLCGCGPTFPAKDLVRLLEERGEKEYNVKVQARLEQNNLLIFTRLEDLFTSEFRLTEAAAEKIEKVIELCSRVVLSSDADIDFYQIVGLNQGSVPVRLNLIRYMEDVVKFRNGWMSVDEYRRRLVWAVAFVPGAGEAADFGQPVTLPQFLAQQISQRLNAVFERKLPYRVEVQGSYENEQFEFNTLFPDKQLFGSEIVPAIFNKTADVLSDNDFNGFSRIVIINSYDGSRFVEEKENLNRFQEVTGVFTE